MQPLVTVSVPIFKCEEFLEKCLDSIRMQTYPALEVTLINDQTPDSSVKIAEEYIERHQLQNWKIYHLEKNFGLSVVRNKGIDTAQGKYLFFLDSDDTITRDCIETLVAISEKTGAEMTVGSCRGIRLPDGETSFPFPIRETKDELNGNSEIFASYIQGNIPDSSWNKLILTSFLKENQLYFVPGLFAQDSLHTFHVMLKITSIAFSRKITYDYYLHEKSVIHNRGKTHFDNWRTIAEYFAKAVQEEKDPLRKTLMMQHLINFKTMTLQMNWRAQNDRQLWKESYRNYKKIAPMKASDALRGKYNRSILKQELLNRLPTALGYWVFRKRWGS